jgi:zinc protease
MRRRMSLCLLLSGASLALAAPAHAKVFDPTVFTLENGLTVVVVENHRAPIVSHMVWYKVGAADEPAGKTGLAHLLEHLMFKGTPEIPAGQFSKLVAAKGGVDNAMTSRDFTAYYQHIAAENLPMVMRMEADRMAHLKLDEKDFQSEREVVREERRQRVENEPAAMLSERLNMALWMNHPYARPIGGFDSEIQGLTLIDALSFHKRWYAPNNAVLFVAGDVTPGQVKSLAEETFGRIPRAATPDRVRGEPEAPQADIRIAFSAPNVHQARWYRTDIVPSCATAAPKVGAAFDMLGEILGGGTTSRLYRQLVLEEKLAVSVGAGYDGTALGPGSFTIGATPMPGTDPDVLDAKISAAIAAIAKDGVTAAELARVRDRMLAARIYARDDLFSAPQALAESLAVGCTIADVETFNDVIAALTADDVKAAAILLDGPHAQGILSPEAAP